jgi:hypothetical protein
MFPIQQVSTYSYFASSILVIYCKLMRHLNSPLIITRFTRLTRINKLKSKFRTTELTYIYLYDICLLITSNFHSPRAAGKRTQLFHWIIPSPLYGTWRPSYLMREGNPLTQATRLTNPNKPISWFNFTTCYSSGPFLRTAKPPPVHFRSAKLTDNSLPSFFPYIKSAGTEVPRISEFSGPLDTQERKE